MCFGSQAVENDAAAATANGNQNHNNNNFYVHQNMYAQANLCCCKPKRSKKSAAIALHVLMYQSYAGCFDTHAHLFTHENQLVHNYIQRISKASAVALSSFDTRALQIWFSVAKPMRFNEELSKFVHSWCFKKTLLV